MRVNHLRQNGPHDVKGLQLFLCRHDPRIGLHIVVRNLLRLLGRCLTVLHGRERSQRRHPVDGTLQALADFAVQPLAESLHHQRSELFSHTVREHAAIHLLRKITDKFITRSLQLFVEEILNLSLVFQLRGIAQDVPQVVMALGEFLQDSHLLRIHLQHGEFKERLVIHNVRRFDIRIELIVYAIC